MSDISTLSCLIAAAEGELYILHRGDKNAAKLEGNIAVEILLDINWNDRLWSHALLPQLLIHLASEPNHCKTIQIWSFGRSLPLMSTPPPAGVSPSAVGCPRTNSRQKSMRDATCFYKRSHPNACHLMPSLKSTVFTLWRLDVSRVTLLIQLRFTRWIQSLSVKGWFGYQSQVVYRKLNSSTPQGLSV